MKQMKIISRNISDINEEQQGFRNNRLTGDAISILREIVEKKNHPCFVSRT